MTASPERVASRSAGIPAGASVGDPRPVTFTATAVLPYDNLERATAGLRGRLRLMVADRNPDASPDGVPLL